MIHNFKISPNQILIFLFTGLTFFLPKFIRDDRAAQVLAPQRHGGATEFRNFERFPRRFRGKSVEAELPQRGPRRLERRG